MTVGEVLGSLLVGTLVQSCRVGLEVGDADTSSWRAMTILDSISSMGIDISPVPIDALISLSTMGIDFSRAPICMLISLGSRGIDFSRVPVGMLISLGSMGIDFSLVSINMIMEFEDFVGRFDGNRVGIFDGNRVGTFDGNVVGVLVVGILKAGELERKLVGFETIDDEDSPNTFIGMFVGA